MYCPSDVGVTESYYYCIVTPWSRVLLEKLTGPQLVKKFPACYGTRRVIAFTIARHLFLFRARTIQSLPSSHYWYTSMLFSHLRLGLPSGVFLSGFSTQNMYNNNNDNNNLFTYSMELISSWEANRFSARQEITRNNNNNNNNLVTPRSRVLLEKLTGSRLDKKLPSTTTMIIIIIIIFLCRLPLHFTLHLQLGVPVLSRIILRLLMGIPIHGTHPVAVCSSLKIVTFQTLITVMLMD
jgi:hypothetical protein